MIHISCSLPEPGSFWWDSWDKPQLGDPATIAEIDLRYKCFDVNAEMVVNGVEFVSKNGFVTLVDLALSIRGVTERLSRGDDAAFGFTQCSDVIHLRQGREHRDKFVGKAEACVSRPRPATRAILGFPSIGILTTG